MKGRPTAWLAQNFDAGDWMYFVPAIFAVGDVGAGDADTIASFRNGELLRESNTCGSIRFACRFVIADGFHDEVASSVDFVHEIQD